MRMLRLLPSEVVGGTWKKGEPASPDVIGTSGDGFVAARATQSSKASFSAGVLNCWQREAGSNSTRLEGIPPGGRCRAEVKLNDASHPLRGVATNAAPRAARPATGCEAISRAYRSSGACSTRALPGEVVGTAFPKMRDSTMNGLFVLLIEKDTVVRSRNGLKIAVSLSGEPWKSE